MKKSKLVMAALTASALVVGGAAFAGCGHVHSYSEDWKSDATNHWHVATCDDLKEGDEDYKSDVAAHVWGNDDECDVCHYKRTTNPPPTGGDDDDDDDDENPPASAVITVSEETLTLSIDKLEAELTAKLGENAPAGAEVVWSSDNESVVLVGEENGYVEALKPGAATITATIKGTEHSATCEVLVEDAYYIIGGQDSLWNKCATFGLSDVIYFMPTETDGIYKTESFELARLANFQVAPVGDTSGDWWKKAFNGDYISAEDTVLSKNSGGNIAVEKHGKYTVTLDLTGDKAVISGVCDEEIDDGDVQTIYYLIGGMNDWTTANTLEQAGDYAFTDNGDGTYSLTAKLTKGWEFKIVVVGMNYNVEFGEGALLRDKIGQSGTATTETTYQLEWTSSANIGVGVEGWYTFTFTPEATSNNQLTYTFSLTDPAAPVEPAPVDPEPAA